MPNRATPSSSGASTRGASPFTPWAVLCSSMRSLMWAISRATRFRSPASSASTPAACTPYMATAEPTPEAAHVVPVHGSRRWVWLALTVVLLGGLGLRLWGVRQGLPYAYNADEADHFVPHAIKMFVQGTLNPHYFANPPGFTYVLHWLFAPSRCTLKRFTRLRASPPLYLERSRCGCCTSPGRGCGEGWSGCSQLRSRRSLSCPCSMRTSRSTMRPRLHLRPCRYSAPPVCSGKDALATTCWPASAWVLRAPPSTPPASCCCRCSWQRSLATSTVGHGCCGARSPDSRSRVSARWLRLSSLTHMRCSITAPSTAN